VAVHHYLARSNPKSTSVRLPLFHGTSLMTTHRGGAHGPANSRPPAPRSLLLIGWCTPCPKLGNSSDWAATPPMRPRSGVTFRRSEWAGCCAYRKQHSTCSSVRSSRRSQESRISAPPISHQRGLGDDATFSIAHRPRTSRPVTHTARVSTGGVSAKPRPPERGRRKHDLSPQ
jgi:hypothetical protein